METKLKIHDAPILLLVQALVIMIFSDGLFFVLLWLVDFANRDSLISNVLTAKEEFVAAIMIFQLGTIIYLFINWMFKYYTFKKNILSVRRGIVILSKKDYILSEIEEIKYSQGLFGRLFDFGNVNLIFPSTSIKFKRIPNPQYFVELINQRENEIK